MREAEKNLFTVEEVKVKMHFYRRKPHHLHTSYQNRTRSTCKTVAIKQSFKESMNTKSLYLGITVLPWKLENPRLLLYTRASRDLSSD